VNTKKRGVKVFASAVATRAAGLALVIATIGLAGATVGDDRPKASPAPSASTAILTSEEREPWADLYFSALSAATLAEGTATAIPASHDALEKSAYLVWKPVLSFPIKDGARKLNADAPLSRRGLLDLQSDLLRRKHRGEKALDAGEIVIARSIGEVLFAAGTRSAKEGVVELFGPRTLSIRRNPEGARFFIYRQVLRALRAFRAARKDLPADIVALTAFAGSLNPEAEKRFDLQQMFDEARREVTSR
jgi:hypothetical protein